MKYKSLATFILVAGLGMLSGCQSSNSCGSSGGLMSRFGCNRNRSTPCCDSGVVGTPVSSSPYGDMSYGDSYGGSPYGGTYGGPTLGDPPFMGSPGTFMPNAMPGPGMSMPPATTMPPPMAGSDGAPRPLPGTIVPGTATPIPAGPSSRFRN